MIHSVKPVASKIIDDKSQNHRCNYRFYFENCNLYFEKSLALNPSFTINDRLISMSKKYKKKDDKHIYIYFFIYIYIYICKKKLNIYMTTSEVKQIETNSISNSKLQASDKKSILEKTKTK